MTYSNRLNLDFSIPDSESRSTYVSLYLQRPEFLKKPPTQSEIEKISDYILWGRNQNGTNSVQDGYIEINTKNGTWDAKHLESLDALVENPSFREPQTTQTRYVIPREVFSRSKTRQTCPSELLPSFEALWRRIDETELLINLKELKDKKRDKPPRSDLKDKFTSEQYAAIEEKANSLSPYEYLKARHLLVELRREQYTLRDSYYEVRRPNELDPTVPVEPVQLDVDVVVRPAGLAYTGVLFPDSDFPTPATIPDETTLKQQLKDYWHRNSSSLQSFDFSNFEHVYQALLLGEEDNSSLSLFPLFQKTLNWYIARASLNESQREILDLKVRRVHNQEIADYINPKYGKSYTANYISTIFRQKIIPAINEAAQLHKQYIENLPYPENFKKCSCCGRTLLLTGDYFVRKQRSVDGFSNQCKECDKAQRQRRKEGK